MIIVKTQINYPFRVSFLKNIGKPLDIEVIEYSSLNRLAHSVHILVNTCDSSKARQ